MRKPILLLVCVLLLNFTNLVGQQYYMTTPEGFGVGTTGGGNASPTIVTTYAALKSALAQTGAAVILVSGTITVPSGGMIKVVVKDKTLLGLPGAIITNTDQTQSGSGCLYLETGSNNVVIRNLTFIGPGAYDVNGNDNLTVKYATKLWVDHCEFQDGMDGNFDMTSLSDNISVSWCKFTYLKPPKAGGSGGTNDHRFSDLIGGNASDAPTDGHYSITFQNCYWAEGCVERMPRARNGELHILNCYYKTSVSGSIAIGLGGGANNTSCYVENCDFASVANVYKNYNSTDGGSVTLTFSNCLKGGSNVGTVAKPTYTYTTFPVANVATAIPDPTCGAGATLKITSNGVIASNCQTVTGIETIDVTSASSIVYPNPSSGSFTIKGREDIKTLTVINTNGETVYTKNNIQQGSDTEITEDVAPGVYFIKIQNNSGSSEMIKFVRSK